MNDNDNMKEYEWGLNPNRIGYPELVPNEITLNRLDLLTKSIECSGPIHNRTSFSISIPLDHYDCADNAPTHHLNQHQLFHLESITNDNPPRLRGLTAARTCPTMLSIRYIPG
jgi:hypothetical protein